MIEIMATIYTISFILSLFLVTWNYTAVSKQVKSARLQRVNLNLQKIGYFWSMTREDFCKLDESTVEADAKSALRSTLMLGLLSFGSAIGFFLMLAITLTMRLLKSSRRGRAVFHSALAEDPDLGLPEIEKLHHEFSQIY
jgi:hypothetical protein